MNIIFVDTQLIYYLILYAYIVGAYPVFQTMYQNRNISASSLLVWSTMSLIMMEPVAVVELL